MVARVYVIYAAIEPDRRESMGSGHGYNGGDVRVREESRSDNSAHGVAHDDYGCTRRVEGEYVVDSSRCILGLCVDGWTMKSGQVFVILHWAWLGNHNMPEQSLPSPAKKSRPEYLLSANSGETWYGAE